MTEKHIIRLTSKTEAKAFMKFLVMERNRHMQDITKITKDILSVKDKWDIPIPIIDQNLWIEV